MARVVREPGTDSRARSDRGTVQATLTVTTPPGRNPPVDTVTLTCWQVTARAARVSRAVRSASARAAASVRASEADRAAALAAASRSICAETNLPHNTTNSSTATSSGVRRAASVVLAPRSPSAMTCRSRSRPARAPARVMARLHLWDNP